MVKVNVRDNNEIYTPWVLRISLQLRVDFVIGAEANCQKFRNALRSVGPFDEIALLACALTGGMILLLPRRELARHTVPARWSLGAAALLLLAAFFVVPAHVHRPMYQWMTNARLAVLVGLLLGFGTIAARAVRPARR